MAMQTKLPMGIELFDNSRLFDGLEISKEKELCEEYMGKFPVISISLKNAASDSFSKIRCAP